MEWGVCYIGIRVARIFIVIVIEYVDVNIGSKQYVVIGAVDKSVILVDIDAFIVGWFM